MDETSAPISFPDRMKQLGILFLTFGGLVLVLVAYVHWTIYEGVCEVTRAAQAQFQGDPVEALIAVLQSDQHTFEEKNVAIWALSELADARALDVLESLHTGTHCPTPCDGTKHVCQYEVEKALENCRRGYNAVSWMWRW